MKLSNVTLFLLLSLFFSVNCLGQNNLTKEEVAKYTTMVKSAVGTYQIQMIDTRKLPTVPLSLIQKIENKRSENEVIYFYFDTNTRVRIASKREIQSKEFVPLERFKSISSSQIKSN